MLLPEDILERIVADFGSDSVAGVTKLQDGQKVRIWRESEGGN